MAKLIPAACPKCGAGVRIDPNSEYVTCSYCGTSSFIQTQKRPVTQELARAHYPVISLPARRSAAWILVPSMLTLVVGIGGAALAFLNSAGSLTQAVSKVDFASLAAKPLLPVPLAKSSLLAPPEDLFKDASGLFARLSAGIGSPLRATELVLYPEHASIRAQDPKVPEHLDDYWYRAGGVQKSGAVQLSGGSKRSLDASLFEVKSLDFSKIPGLVADAVKAIPVEDAKVSHIIIEKSHQELRYRVYVSSERESGGYVEYSPKAERRLVMK